MLVFICHCLASECPHALVQVLALLCQVEVHLVTYEYLVATIARIYCRRIHLVRVAHHHSVHIATY